MQMGMEVCALAGLSVCRQKCNNSIIDNIKGIWWGKVCAGYSDQYMSDYLTQVCDIYIEKTALLCRIQ